MNELNLQNPEFRKFVWYINLGDNQIVVGLYPKEFVGFEGPLLLLLSTNSVLSTVQTWDLIVPKFYPTDSSWYFSGITSFDEIKNRFL